ncbi:hypothetical protein FRC10_003926 [Ceratobasidium sp. 414]|nr:hypothetical protein FRC10_003926 [Ceratobasidium sp. 414]
MTETLGLVSTAGGKGVELEEAAKRELEDERWQEREGETQLGAKVAVGRSRGKDTLVRFAEPVVTAEYEYGYPTAREPCLPAGPAKRKPVYDKELGVWVEQFPDPRAGTPINDDLTFAPDIHVYMSTVGNLGNPKHFATAELLMTTRLTAAGRDEHLKSHIYVGQTPWKTNKMLMDDIDKLPHGPGWAICDIGISIPGHAMQHSYLMTRHVVEVVSDIVGNPSFAEEMHFVAERHFADENCMNRVYGNSWSANWWWRTQLHIPDKSATIVLLVIASDWTRLSAMSGGQQAYPVYLTVANIDKSVRQETNRKATALLAYLPVDDFEHAESATEKARLKHTLMHRAMEKVMEPLHTASKGGVVMRCADGRFRHVYPIVAGDVGDWQEQCMMGCVSESGCPKCQKKREGRGDSAQAAP